ncbi:MAG: MBL fold metallo-hydrolase [Candidatus Aenigmatarchaeota archaeon]
MKITFFGGINEIGGNKILIESSSTKFFIDFGLSFSKFGKYYTDFLQPRLCNGIGDLLDLEIIPDLDGIYRNDLLANEGRKTSDEPKIDGVFLSHAHSDHVGHVSLLHKDMNIFCGETCKIILKALQESSMGGFENDYYWFRENFVKRRDKPKTERKYVTFRTGDKIKINDIEVEPIHVDHSIPGSYAFIIYTPEGNIAYTGDFRSHGTKSYMTEDFIERAKEEKIDILLCEGTRVNEREKSLSEEEVYQKVKEIIRKTRNMVFVNFSFKDVDRLNTFFKACRDGERIFAVSTKLAFLIKELQKDKHLNLPNFDEIKVYMHRSKWGIYEKEDYNTWERDFLDGDYVTAEDLKKSQEKYVLFMDFFDLKELIDIKPKAGSSYIYSSSEPHNEEQLIDFERLKNWINRFGLEMYTIHASGHANYNEIGSLIEKIGAKKVVPIHTEHPFMFENFTKNLIIPSYSEPIEL